MQRVLRNGFISFRSLKTASEAATSTKDVSFMDLVDGVLQEKAAPVELKVSHVSEIPRFKSLGTLNEWLESQKELDINQITKLTQALKGLPCETTQSSSIVDKSWSKLSCTLQSPDYIQLLATLLNLNLKETNCFKSIETHLEENVTKLLEEKGIPPSLLFLFHAAHVNNYTFSDKVFKTFTTIVENQIKTVEKPSEILTLLNNFYPMTVSCLTTILEQVKVIFPIMSKTETIGLIRCLRLHKKREISILAQGVQRIVQDKELLSLRQIVELTEAFAFFKFFDARILRRLDNDLCLQINQLKSWNDLSTLAVCFSGMRLNNPQLWLCLSNWANANTSSATPDSISRVITAFALMGVKNAKPAAEYSAKKLKRISTPSPSHWLNAIYGLAFFEVITPEQAETVLHKDFVKELMNAPNHQQVYYALRLMQIQEVVKKVYGSRYAGPTIDRNSFGLELDSKEMISIAERGKYKKGVAAYKDMFVTGGLHKVAPQSYFGGSYIDDIGILVDERVIIENDRLVPTSEWKGREKDIIPVIFVNWHNSLRRYDQTEQSNKPEPYAGLFVRLLEQRGRKAIYIYESELTACATQAEKIALLKKKLFSR